MLKESYRQCRDALQSGGVEAADFEALCLLRHVTGCGRAELIAHGDAPVTEEKAALLHSLTQKRLTRYPLQYLLGAWEFMGFPLSVGEGVLIPRDDTEVCTRLCLDFLKGRPHAAAVDLCSGSGAIAIALEKLAGAEVTAVELSDNAFIFLQKNINKNHCRVKAVHGDIFTCHADFADGSLDLIVSNPPYIPQHELPGLQAEVQFEPAMALDGGTDGMDFYRAIVRDWTPKLKNGGAMVFELGEHQAAPVAALLTAAGFTRIRTEQDFGGCERAISATFAKTEGEHWAINGTMLDF